MPRIRGLMGRGSKDGGGSVNSEASTWSADHPELDLSIDLAKVYPKAGPGGTTTPNGPTDKAKTYLLRFFNALFGPEALSFVVIVTVILSASLLPQWGEDAAFLEFRGPLKVNPNMFVRGEVGLDHAVAQTGEAAATKLSLSSLSPSVESLSHQVSGGLIASIVLGCCYLVLVVVGRFLLTVFPSKDFKIHQYQVEMMRMAQFAWSLMALGLSIFLLMTGIGRLPGALAHALQDNPQHSLVVSSMDTSTVTLHVSTSHTYQLEDGTCVMLKLPAASRYLAASILWLLFGICSLLSTTICWSPRQRLREMVETAMLSTRIIIQEENPNAVVREPEFQLEIDLGQIYHQGQPVVHGKVYTRIANGLMGPELLCILLTILATLSFLLYPHTYSFYKVTGMAWLSFDADILPDLWDWAHIDFFLYGYEYINFDMTKHTGPLSDLSPRAASAAAAIEGGLVASMVMTLLSLFISILLRFYIAMISSHDDADDEDSEIDEETNNFKSLFHPLLLVRYFRLFLGIFSLGIAAFLAVYGYLKLPTGFVSDISTNPQKSPLLSRLYRENVALYYDPEFAFDPDYGCAAHIAVAYKKFVALVALWAAVGVLLLATTTCLWGHGLGRSTNPAATAKGSSSTTLSTPGTGKRGSSKSDKDGPTAPSSPVIEYHNPNASPVAVTTTEVAAATV